MIDIILVFLIVLLGFCVALEIISVMVKSKKKKHLHEVLIRRITQLRLSKMLKFLGADIEKYAQKVPVADINLHIHRCWRCTEHKTCDGCLRDGKRVDDMSFCPNHEALTQHSKTIAGKN